MNHRTATYLSPLLAHCCKALGMSVGLAATPPYKSVIYNTLYALSLARGGAMRRVNTQKYSRNFTGLFVVIRV